MQRQKQLTFFTQSYSQASVIFPYLMVSPAYFSGAMQLGGLMQTASAFNSVQTALSYFITAYQSIAQYHAVVQRLSGFEDAIVAGREVALTPPAIEVLPRADAERDCDRSAPRVACRTASRWSMPSMSSFAPGERVLVTGPSGAGKSTLFRAHHRHLAVRLGPRHGAGRRQSDAAAAAALFPGGDARRGRQLPGQGRHASTMPASPR